MARSRNIKPGFFLNDELAELDPLARLLFIGLWTIADYNGRLEYRPKKIKAEVLPYDNCDIEALMIDLDKSRFITIYTLQENTYIEISNFTKHQNPHPNERKKGSDIPPLTHKDAQVIDYKELAINRDKSRLNHDNSITDRADSLILIPDSLKKNKKEKPASRFEEWYAHYPVKKSKEAALKSWIKQKLDPRTDELIAILQNQKANDAQWKSGIGIPHPSTYLNQQRWEDEVTRETNKPVQYKTASERFADNLFGTAEGASGMDMVEAGGKIWEQMD